MKDSTHDHIEGNAKQAAGKVKEVTGRAVNSPNLQTKGIGEQVEGKVQEKAGDIEKAAGN